MHILKASDYKASHEPDGTYITISLTGTIALNINVVRLLNIQPEERMIIARDDAGDYFIGKSKSKDNLDAYKVRQFNGAKSLQFNAKGVINEIVREKDLALHKDKKTSIRLPVSTTDPRVLDGVKLYEIQI